MPPASTRARIAVVVGLGALSITLALQAALAGATTPSIKFVSTPSKAAQGGHVSATVVVSPKGVTCRLVITYQGGTKTSLPARKASSGKATWRWTIPVGANPGIAVLVATCGSAGTTQRTLIVIASSAAIKVTVLKTGWSVRNRSTGGADVSYGVLLQNPSTSQDAQNIDVVVNFVMADGRLLGTQSQSVPLITPGQIYAYGATMSFVGAAPITSLEVIVTVGGHASHTPIHIPRLDNIALERGQNDVDYVGDIVGEIVDDDPSLVLRSAQLSAVVLDGAGNIVGGGSGFFSAALQPGTRGLFKLLNGFRPIPWANAASTLISVIPTYQ
jgi:hypothetical protein